MNREKMNSADYQARQQLLKAVGTASAVAPVLDFDTPFQEPVRLGRRCRGCLIKGRGRIEPGEQSGEPENGDAVKKNRDPINSREITASGYQVEYPELEIEHHQYGHAA